MNDGRIVRGYHPAPMWFRPVVVSEGKLDNGPIENPTEAVFDTLDRTCHR